MPRQTTNGSIAEGTAGAPSEGTPEGASPNRATPRSDKLVLCSFSDHAVLCDPDDDKIAATLISGRPYQRRHIESAMVILEQAGRLPSGGLFLDIGANIGTTTLYAMRSGRFSRALALEPEPYNYGILTQNVVLNRLSAEVETIAGAAGARPGQARLNIAARNFGAHSLAPLVRAAGAGRAVVVPVTTGDLAVAQSRARVPTTLAKIDVEGHELAVLDGMTGLTDMGVPLLIELTCMPEEPAAAMVAALRSRLAACYRNVVDLEHATPACLPEPIALAKFAVGAPQHDLLIY